MTQKTDFTDQELARYSRQILLPEFEVAGQLVLANSHVAIVGLGGLGSAASFYLAASGVGKLTLVDGDTVDASNLQRQIVHTEERIGQSKVTSAAGGLAAINKDLNVDCIAQYADDIILSALLPTVDLVLDCSDNFQTRQLVNAACYQNRVPLVSGAAIRYEGQISVFDFRDSQSPCYQCLFGSIGDSNLSCSESGVLSPVVGVLGSLQAMEAIKVLARLGQSLVGRVVMFDGLRHQWREFGLRRDAQCVFCGEQQAAKQVTDSPLLL